MWPFAKKYPFPGVEQKPDGTIEFSLSDEEAREADLALQAFKGVLFHSEIADTFRNGIIAAALSRYAKDLVSMHCIGVTKSDYRAKWPMIHKTLQKAVAAVWKSYSLYSLPCFLYYRASYLDMLGMRDEARQLFVSFRTKQAEFKMEEVDKILLEYEGTTLSMLDDMRKQSLSRCK
jgi:hypothetical protein